LRGTDKKWKGTTQRKFDYRSDESGTPFYGEWREPITRAQSVRKLLKKKNPKKSLYGKKD